MAIHLSRRSICLWVALDCITDRERVVVRSAEAVSDVFISKSLEAMLITVVAFIIRTISHHNLFKLSRDDISENWRSSCACPLGAET